MAAAVPVAIIGGSIIGGLIANKGAKSASDSQSDAAKDATELQYLMYQQQREDLAPWTAAGEWALGKASIPAAENVKDLQGQRNALATALRGTPSGVTKTTTPGSREAMLYSKGWNPETGAYTGSYLDSGQHYTSDEEARIRRLIQTEGPQTRYTTKYTPPENAAEIQKQIDLLDQQIAAGGKEIPGTGLIGMIERGPGEFEESPSYQFALSEGLKGQQNALSAMGRNRSGAHLKSATDYAENMASTEYQNFLNRWYQSLTPYQSLAGLGQTSASQTASAAGNYGAQAGANQIYAGQAQAAGQINQANVLTGAIQGGTNQLLYLNALRNVPQTGTASAPNYNYGYGAGYSGYGQGGY